MKRMLLMALIGLLSHVLLFVQGPPLVARDCERLLTPLMDDLRVTAPCPANAHSVSAPNVVPVTATSVINPTKESTTASVIVSPASPVRHAEEVMIAGKSYAPFAAWMQAALRSLVQSVMTFWPAVTKLSLQWVRLLFGAWRGL